MTEFATIGRTSTTKRSGSQIATATAVNAPASANPSPTRGARRKGPPV